MATRTCRECGEPFEGSNNGQAYCSDNCRLPERDCKACGEPFRPKTLPKRNQTFCSTRCAVLGRKPARPKNAAYMRALRYGISPQEQELLLKQQNHTCRICEEPAQHLDHDEGGVRGFLCAKCNIGLGHFRDRPDLLAGAIDYLRKASSVIPGRLRITENVRLELRNPMGELADVRDFANTVTTNGKAGIADQILASPSLGKPTHMAIGTGSPGANALGTESDRNALTSKTRSGAVVTMVGDWAAGDGTGAITEAGIFDASSSGNAWTTASFSAINKAAGDTLSISWTLTIS